MKRQTGYYWVKYGSKWFIAEWFERPIGNYLWKCDAHNGYAYDSQYTEINESILSNPDEQSAKEDKWSKLDKIGSPDQWIEVYKEYQEMLTREDVTAFWHEQFMLADRERQLLKNNHEKNT